MKTLWKALALTVLIAMLASMAGCGATPTATPAPTTTKAAAAAPTAAPAPPTATKAPAKPKNLVVAESKQYSETLDVFKASTTMYAHNLIYEGLVAVDSNYQFVPGLADSWEVSKDGLTWTFKLRRGIKFHDGADFTADVVKWWIEGMQKGVNSYMFESATEVKVVDANTIAITFSAPFPNLLYNLSTSFSGIMSKAAFEKYGAEYGTKYAVGTGPFMLKEWVANTSLTVVKNPNYNWAPAWTKHTGAAKLDSVTFRFIPEDATRLIELQAGGVQVMLDPPPAREVANLKKDANLKVLEASDDVIQFIGFNLNDPLFKDLKTRKAVGHAIDRKLIVETIYQGAGSATTTYLSRELGGNKGAEAVAPAFDIAKAKALLAEAGWKPGADGILVADNVAGVTKGAKFEVSYLTYQEDQFKRLAEVTQKMLADVGIKANTQSVDNPTYIAQLKAGTFQLILRQYSWDNNDILEWFHHGKYLKYPNYTGVNDKKFDEMLDDANFKTALWEDRDAKYQAIHKYLIETWYPWAPVRQANMTLTWRTSVLGFAPLPLKGAASTYVWLVTDLDVK